MASLRAHSSPFSVVVCRTGVFTNYAILGDDIVIADEQVARPGRLIEVRS